METVKEALGLGPKVRYAIVGLGDISQRALMPNVHHTGNSKICALVTSDPEKAEELAQKYGIGRYDIYSYENFDQLLSSRKVDAIYLATPNWRHEEFAVPALRAGVHVLLEKPMEVSTEKCQAILEAQKASNAKLMIAYRLHFEPATIAAIDEVRSGNLGKVHMFSSIFAQPLDPKNHRAQNGWKGGPLFDMGTYPLNAVRNLFEAEPIEVSALGFHHPESGFPSDLDDTVAVTLVFPENRVAQFIVSYYGNPLDEYTISGTKGSIHLSPAFMYETALQFAPIKSGEKEKTHSFKNTDQFGGEMKYFSECILKGKDPEPDGFEGLADVRVLEAALRSLQSKLPVKLESEMFRNKIPCSQEQNLRFKSLPDEKKETNAAPPSK